MRLMTPSHLFPALARRPNWTREMTTPVAKEWDHSVNDAKSTKNHCGKLHTAPTWMYSAPNSLYQGCSSTSTTSSNTNAFGWGGQLANKTIPETLARYGLGKYFVAMVQLSATMEEAEEGRKLVVITDRVRLLPSPTRRPTRGRLSTELRSSSYYLRYVSKR